MNQAAIHTASVTSEVAYSGHGSHASHFDEKSGNRLMCELEQSFPEWFGDLDAADVLFGDFNALCSVMKTAPDHFMAGHLLGVGSVRISVSSVLNNFEAEPAPYTSESIQVARATSRLFEEQAEAQPAWTAALDGADNLYASVNDLRDLLATAPTRFLRGYIHGVLTMRRHVDAHMALRCH